MKNEHCFVTFIIIICFPFLFPSCSNQTPLKPNTPVNTAIVMKNYLDAGNYQGFNKLFTDGRENAVSEEQFNELKKITTAGMDLKHYELLTFSNGKMILITLTQDKIDGEYKIQDIKEIPGEMKSLLK